MATAITQTNKIRVLIGDDSKEFGNICADLLRQAGFYVASRPKDGSVILETLKSSPFDLVIIDSLLPHFDALSIMKVLKETSDFMPLFLIVTSYENPTLERQLLSNGAAYFLLKPFDPMTLVKISKELMKTNKERAMELSTGQPDMEVIVTELIHQLGVPAHIKGYHYLREAILLCLDNTRLMESVTKELYPTVATRFVTTPSRVERAIRHAIEIAWDRGNVEILQEYFGYTINQQKGKPTNSEFIALLVDRIRLSYRQVAQNIA
ncbi:MAG: sporulation transcription factor Spo0A [Oscillospiraceae bacterium]|jgi:two-component system response regulator (stage 0 sporulation protein A)|nr:sporulation transcription factor Spo0A [Oscillospiraceae bacterium]